MERILMPYTWRDPFVRPFLHHLSHPTIPNSCPSSSHCHHCHWPFIDFHRYDQQQKLKLEDHTSRLTFDEEGNFTYKVDVQGYRKEELSVDVMGDDIKVKAEHKANTEGGF
ncbi:hypothetical protein DdX_17990 [Ditylenchus destructor]|uniref:SHSP domain-containing protein n=1 Tax=Ditylenchus destructor TaxID=166010 RepID=A0AAD4MKQ2_9BILA|nr:hypothetical protein DdX_17990 [Ditylenchus destructor]